MKYILGILLIFCAFAANAQPRYPGDDRPIIGDSQRHCRHLYREREMCKDRQCMRYMDRKIRYCMTR
jgi:hypothetical protein